jgi:hypothetical protein
MGVAKIRGESPRLQARTTGGSGSWRGLLLRLTGGGQSLPADNTMYAVELNHTARDTDAFVSTGSETVAGVSVPAGAAGVVPVGLAGDYRLSGVIMVHSDSIALANFSLFYALIVNGFAYASAYFDVAVAGYDGGEIVPAVTLVVSPFVVTLAEGDVAALFVQNAGSEALEVQYGLSGGGPTYMLMEYLGPV